MRLALWSLAAIMAIGLAAVFVVPLFISAEDVRNKLFAMYAAPTNHHGAGPPAVWCKAAPGNQALMVRAEPARYFVPPYVGPSGWVGVWLDRNPDWSEVRELMRDSYRLVAPKKLAALLGGDE